MIQKIKNNPFARNSLILFAGTMAASFLNYLFHLVIGRMVSVEIYGEIESLISLVSIISVPAMALTMVATKFGAGYKAEDDKKGNYELFKYLNRKVLALIIPIFLLAVFLTPLFKKFLNIENNTAIILVWMIMALSFVSSVAGGILSGWQKFKESSWAGVWGALIKFLSAVIIIKAGFALGGAISGFFLGTLASYAVILYFLQPILQNRGKSSKDVEKNIDFGQIKKYILPVLIGNVAISILGNADMVLAKHNLDPQSAGQYGALTIVSKIIFFATGIIATVLFSMSAENNHKKDDSLVILKHAIWAMAAVSIVSIVFYFSFPQFILRMLFGAKYDGVSYLLGWFSILVVLYSFANMFIQYFLSVHKTKIVHIFLVISVLEIIAILLVGKSISAILISVIISQFLAVAASLLFLFKLKKSAVV